MPRLVPAAVAIAALIAVFLGAMYLRFSGNRILPPNLGSSSELAQVRAIGCRWDNSSRIGGGGFIDDPIEATLAAIRDASPCNQPDPSTAKATRSTWDSARAMVRAQGGSLAVSCDPGCLPDDYTKVWLVEVRGSFVAPIDANPGALVPDSAEAIQAASTTPVPGTWFAIVPVLSY